MYRPGGDHQHLHTLLVQPLDLPGEAGQEVLVELPRPACDQPGAHLDHDQPRLPYLLAQFSRFCHFANPLTFFARAPRVVQEDERVCPAPRTRYL